MSETQDSTDESNPDASTVTNPTTLATYVEWGVLLVLALLSAIATLQFYSNVSRAIDIWVAREYVPLFQAGFNLIILLAAIVGISLLVRRLSE